MKKVLIIGDTLLDVYSEGKIERFSPEAANVPVFDYIGEFKRLGGACNVAANIRTLAKEEYEIHYFGFYSFEVLKMLEEYKIQCFGIPNGDILIKNRFITNNRQVFRLDKGLRYSSEYEKVFLMKLNQHLIENKDYSLIVISDYNKGTVNDGVLFRSEDYKNCLKIVDIKKLRGLAEYDDFSTTIFKCNEKEFEENNGLRDFKCAGYAVTCGEKGYYFHLKNSSGMDDVSWAPSLSKEPPVDVTGAGDAFVAGMAVAYLESDNQVRSICDLGNKAAAAKIKHVGTTAVKREWL